VTGGELPGTKINGSGGLLTVDLGETANTLTVKATSVADPSKSGAATVTVNKPQDPTGHVKIEFSGLPQDETITLDRSSDPLSWKENTTLTVTVSETFDGYRWALDGVILAENTNTLTLYAGALEAKQHTLTVFVKRGVVEYAKILTFKVDP
jgi:hypothetical protein